MGTHHRQMILFWSGDSASLDRVGAWAAGDLLFPLHTILSLGAGEEGKMLHLRHPDWEWKEKRQRNHTFWRVG